MAQAARNISRKPDVELAQEAGEVLLNKLTNARQMAGLIGLLALLLILLLAGISLTHWLNDNSRLSIDKLIITGKRVYTTDNDIRNIIVNLAPLGTFMSQNVNNVQQQVEQLPWIKQVSVRKQWPDELVVNIVEYQPFAFWNGRLLLDREGNVFSLPASRLHQQGLPLLAGPEGSENEVLDQYLQLNNLLIAHKFRLKSIIMSATGFWTLILENNVELIIGKSNIAQSLNHFFIIYPILLEQQQKEHKKVQYIDLRYNSGVAVGWQPDGLSG